MDISSNIATINKHLNTKKTKLIVVTKNQDPKLINEVYKYGCRDFAENKVQNLIRRKAEFPNDIRWHMIGHLQTNKVKQIAAFVYLIHSVDSIKLAEVINKEAKNNNRIISILLQVNISNEQKKYGFSYDELTHVIQQDLFKDFHNLKVRGLMGMASDTVDYGLVNLQFKSLNNYYQFLKNSYFKNCKNFEELSIGMSGDYLLALDNGSTMVRLGSAIFKH